MTKQKLKLAIRKNSPSILTGIGIIGFWTMGVLIFKSAPKVKDELSDQTELKKLDTNNSTAKLTPIEKAKIVLPVMWPTLAIGGISTYSIVSANKINLRRNAALASAYYISQNALHEYQERVIENLGKRKEQKIRDEVAQHMVEKNPLEGKDVIVTGKGDHLCYDAVFGTYFESNIEKVKQAVLNLDERLIHGNEMYITVNEFRSELDLPPIEAGRDLGWKIEDGQMNIEFSSCLASDGRPCLVIRYEVGPV